MTDPGYPDTCAIWRGKAGGYAIQGRAGAFLVKLVGSYTAVVGLPLYETTTLLSGEGYPIRFGWIVSFRRRSQRSRIPRTTR